MRPPVVQNYEVRLADLPHEMDKTVLVALSDLHLGALIGKRWLAARVAQVKEQRPDLVVFLGDLFEGHGQLQDELIWVRSLSCAEALLPGLPRLRRQYPLLCFSPQEYRIKYHSKSRTRRLRANPGRYSPRCYLKRLIKPRSLPV
jgi:predicted MPP superfamily phosphohydrolase